MVLKAMVMNENFSEIEEAIAWLQELQVREENPE